MSRSMSCTCFLFKRTLKIFETVKVTGASFVEVSVNYGRNRNNRRIFMFPRVFLLKKFSMTSKSNSMRLVAGILSGCCFSKQTDADENSPLCTVTGVPPVEECVVKTEINKQIYIPCDALKNQDEVYIESVSICDDVATPSTKASTSKIYHVDSITKQFEKKEVDDVHEIERNCHTQNKLYVKQVNQLHSAVVQKRPLAVLDEESSDAKCLKFDAGFKTGQPYVIDLPGENEKELNNKEQEKKNLCGSKDNKINQKKPNYFVALKISNPEIQQLLREVQQHIIEQDKRFEKSMIPLATSHITLMVMHISDSPEYLKAFEALKEVFHTFNESMLENPLKLEFKGLGHFKNKVVFAKISLGDSFNRLCNLAEQVVRCLNKASIYSTDKNLDFKPHLTLMKLSRDARLYRKGIKTIKPALYALYKDELFGHQIVQGIQLLSMLNPKDETGYYCGDELLFDILVEKHM